MFKCRTICKRWTFGVDKFLETHASLQPYDDEYEENDNSIKKKITWVSLLQQELEDQELPYSLTVIGALHIGNLSNKINIDGDKGKTGTAVIRKPFVGRSITFCSLDEEFIEDNGDEVSRLFFDKICSVLENVGKFVWYIHIKAMFSNLSVSRFYVDFCRCLRLLPNIKLLGFVGSVTRFVNVEDEIKLKNLQENMPLPKLKHLNTVKLCVCSLPIDMEKYVYESLNFNNNIKKVYLNLYESSFYSNIFRKKWLNLSELILDGITEELLKKMNSCIMINETCIRLKKIVGHFEDFGNISIILDLLRIFHARVVHIISSVALMEGDASALMPISSIHTLKIVDGMMVQFKFLNILPNLKKLHVLTNRFLYQNEIFIKKRKMGLVKNIIYKCLHCDNWDIVLPRVFWEKFPKLDKVQIVEGTIINSNDFDVTRKFVGVGKCYSRYQY